MPVRHAQLQDLNYVPSYNTLDPNLINTVDNQISQQVQQGQLAIDEFDVLGEEINQEASALPEQDKIKLQDTLRQKREELDNYVDKYGVRGALQKAQRTARDFQSEAAPYLNTSTAIRKTMEAIEESEANPNLKSAARWKIQQNVGDSIFDEQRNIRTIDTTTIKDIISNPIDLTEFSMDYVKNIKDRSKENFEFSQLSSNAVGRWVESGILPTEAAGLAVDNLLATPQARAQLMLEAEHLSKSGAFNNFITEENNPDNVNFLTTTVELTDPETGKKVNQSPLEQLATQYVVPAANTRAWTITAKNVTSTLDSMLGGKPNEATQVLTGISSLRQSTDLNKGKNFLTLLNSFEEEQKGIQNTIDDANESLRNNLEESGITDIEGAISQDQYGFYEFTDSSLYDNSIVSNALQNLNGATSQARKLENKINSIRNSAQNDLKRTFAPNGEFTFVIDTQTNKVNIPNENEFKDFIASQEGHRIDLNNLEIPYRKPRRGVGESVAAYEQRVQREQDAFGKQSRTSLPDSEHNKLENLQPGETVAIHSDITKSGPRLEFYKNRDGELFYLGTQRARDMINFSGDTPLIMNRMRAELQSRLDNSYTSLLDKRSKEATETPIKETWSHALNRNNPAIKQSLESIVNPATLLTSGTLKDENGELVEDLGDLSDFSADIAGVGFMFDFAGEGVAFDIPAMVDGEARRLILTGQQAESFAQEFIPEAQRFSMISSSMLGALASKKKVGNHTTSFTFSKQHLQNLGFITQRVVDGETKIVTPLENLKVQHVKRQRNFNDPTYDNIYKFSYINEDEKEEEIYSQDFESGLRDLMQRFR